MGKGSDLYFQQQQARQLREMEKHQAAQSGQPLRKLSWTERNVLGLRDEPTRPTESVLAKAMEEVELARRNRKQEKRTRKEARAAEGVPSSAEGVPGGAEGVPSSAGADEGASSMQVRGYMIDVTWDGQTLTVVAANKAARVALRGQDHGEGPLALKADDIESTELKPASALVNGHITISTKDGERYLLHFRRKSNTEFARLYKALPG